MGPSDDVVKVVNVISASFVAFSVSYNTGLVCKALAAWTQNGKGSETQEKEDSTKGRTKVDSKKENEGEESQTCPASSVPTVKRNNINRGLVSLVHGLRSRHRERGEAESLPAGLPLRQASDGHILVTTNSV